MHYLLSFALILFVVASSSYANELATFSPEELDTALSAKNYRKAVFLITSKLLEDDDSALLSNTFLEKLDQTYTTGGYSKIAQELTEARSSSKKLRAFLERERTITSPLVEIQSEPNGDIVIGTKAPDWVVKKRTCLVTNTRILKKGTSEYKTALAQYWWFKI